MFNRLRELRTEKNIPVEQLCSLLGLETQSAYYKKETGNVKFTLSEAKKIAVLLDMAIEDIFLQPNFPDRNI